MPGDLALSAIDREGCIVVTVVGEVDLGTADQLVDYAAAGLQRSGPNVVMDLGGVTFMDSAGLKALLACHHRAQLLGGALGLAGPTRPVARLFTVMGLDQTLVIRGTVDEAVHALATTGSGAPAVAD
jgi:anti-sigma B factor antagonist